MTRIERKILLNQLLILKKVDPENEEVYAEHTQILEKGFTLEYEEVLAGIYEEFPQDDCEYVREVLDMHTALKRSYEALDDKEGLPEGSVEYRGFDGNNEARHFGYASFLSKQGLWSDINGKLNSHFPTSHRYPVMLKKWAALGKRWDLTAAEIREVISA